MEEHLKVLESRLQDIQTGIVEIRAIYGVQQKRIDHLESEVWGNGRTGLAVKVNALIYGVSIVGSMVALILSQTIANWFRG